MLRSHSKFRSFASKTEAFPVTSAFYLISAGSKASDSKAGSCPYLIFPCALKALERAEGA